MSYKFPSEYEKCNNITKEYYKYDGEHVSSHITDMLDKFIKDIEEEEIDDDKKNG